MNLNVLAKVLPTSENSIAYTHMLFFPLEKNFGIRKWVPNAIDVRVNAIALVIFSAVDLVLSGTKLCLYVVFIVPIFKNNMKPLIKDFICSITTIVKATLAIIHGKNHGLLALTSYQKMEKAIARDPTKAKHCLSTLSPPNTDDEKEILRRTVSNIGLNDSLWFLLKQNKSILLNEVVQSSNSKSALLELCIPNYNRLTPKNRDTLFQCFGCDTSNFVISVLLDPKISEVVKNNLEGLSLIQTNFVDGVAAKNHVINELETTISQLPVLLPAVQKEKTAARNELNEAKNKLGLGVDDVLPPELIPLKKTFDEATKKENLLNMATRGLVVILNRDVNVILSITPEIFEKIKYQLNPSFRAIKELFKSGRIADFDTLLEKIPDALARSVDPDTGESLVTYLLNTKNDKIALDLLRLDSSKITTKTVFMLLDNGAEWLGISQEDLEEILSESHETLVKLYREKETPIKKVTNTPADRFHNLKMIGLHFTRHGNSEKVEYGFKSFLEHLLVNCKVIEMLHKDSPISKPVLLDIPGIDVVSDGVALGHAVGMPTPGLRKCLVAIQNAYKKNSDRSVEIKTKHIIQTLEDLRKPNNNIDFEQHQKNIGFIQSMLAYLDSEGNGGQKGNTGCIGMKQDVVNYIWNAITGAQFEDAAHSNRDRLDQYLSGFKDDIALKIPPLDAHVRMKWGKTLSNKRKVESANPGDVDSYFGTNLRKEHVPEALTFFDAEYRPDAFIAFLRKGLNDKRNKLDIGVSDVLAEFQQNMKLTPDQRAELLPLLTEFNGQYTDFALFCVLVNLRYINF